MLFKKKRYERQYEFAPTLLRHAASDFQLISRKFGKEPVITRILGKIEGDSGVHNDYRGIDFRDEHLGKFMYTEEERETLLELVNLLYPRVDGFKTLIWHGETKHFHLQVSSNTKNHRRGK